MTHAAELLKETGPAIRARPMQYIDTSQLELDSYLQLTQAVRLRVSRLLYARFYVQVYSEISSYAYVCSASNTVIIVYTDVKQLYDIGLNSTLRFYLAALVGTINLHNKPRNTL